MQAVFKKELNYYLNTPLGYIPLILFALVINFLFVRETFITGSVTFPTFFNMTIWASLIFIPALVMRTFSEEKRLNTIEVLLSLPISETQIVTAKFLANLVLAILGLVLTLALPLTFYTLAHIYLPEVLVGYVGVILMEAAFIAVSMFFSSLTKNQIISFLGSLLTLFVLVSLSAQLVVSLFPALLQDMLTYISPVYHLQNFMEGILDVRSVFYFASITAVFLFLTVMQIEKRS
jgi:ABC-2 type transport system permease protein